MLWKFYPKAENPVPQNFLIVKNSANKLMFTVKQSFPQF